MLFNMKIFSTFWLLWLANFLSIVEGSQSSPEIPHQRRRIMFQEPTKDTIWILPSDQQKFRVVLSLKKNKKFPDNFTIGLYENRKLRLDRFIDYQCFNASQLLPVKGTTNQFELELTEFQGAKAFDGLHYLYLSTTTNMGQKLLAETKKFRILRVGKQKGVPKPIRYIDNFEPADESRVCQPGQPLSFVLTQQFMHPIPDKKRVFFIVRNVTTGDEVGKSWIDGPEEGEADSTEAQDSNESTGSQELLQLRIDIPMPKTPGKFVVDIVSQHRSRTVTIYRSDIITCRDNLKKLESFQLLDEDFDSSQSDDDDDDDDDDDFDQ